MRENRIDARTLIIASIASAAAAVLTSQFWIRGTPFAAAVTPIIVTLVSELLHRPSDRIARRLSTGGGTLPEATGGAGHRPTERRAPASGSRPADRGARAPAGRQPPRREPRPEFKVYRAGGARRRRIAWATVLTTGLLAFLIAAVALTVPELIAGGAVGGRDRATTLVPSQRSDAGETRSTPAATDEQPAAPDAGPAETAPQTQETAPETAPAERSPQTAPTTREAPPPTTTTPTDPTAPAR